MKGITKKFAFFDFCDTLVGFQTADAFVDYVRLKNGNSHMRMIESFLEILHKSRIITVLNKLVPRLEVAKRIKLYQLKGFGIHELNTLSESFYSEMVKPGLIDIVLKDMKRLADDDYEICLVSAGYSIYLKYFADEYQIKHLISTEIAFNQEGNTCLGTISGRDCIRREKVSRLKSYLEDQNVNYKESISYSDNITDLPLLLMAGKGVVISKGSSQPWRHKYNFKEIIWNKN